MGYQVVTVHLADGRTFDDVTVVEGLVADVPGYTKIPFSEAEIVDLVVTHARPHR
jgi:hypothetical protein